MKIGAVGREDFARMFVPFAEGTNADRRFAIACPREELPSLNIELLFGVAIPRRALKPKKLRVSAWVLLLYGFLDKFA